MLISNNVTRMQNIDKRIKILKYLKNNLISNTYLFINLYEPCTVVKAGNDMDKWAVTLAFSLILFLKDTELLQPSNV